MYRPVPHPFFRLFRGLLGAGLLILCSACSPIPGRLLVMEGNFFSSREMFTEAIASYLKALEYAEAAPYAEYGLGSVYFILDEEDAALERFDSAGNTLEELNREKHRELIYRIRYNAGIVHFQKKDYAGAAEAFRMALKIDGSRLDAKRNLELSLLALSREASPQAAPASEIPPADQEQAELIFDYIRMKERERWKSREWLEDDTSPGPDY